jgi:predicted PurR-regulated permease PerM
MPEQQPSRGAFSPYLSAVLGAFILLVSIPFFGFENDVYAPLTIAMILSAYSAWSVRRFIKSSVGSWTRTLSLVLSASISVFMVSVAVGPALEKAAGNWFWSSISLASGVIAALAAGALFAREGGQAD